jgi:hypothetical protein
MLASLALSAFSQVGPANAAPNYETLPVSYRDASGDWDTVKRADLVPLRILPLGASIMTGVGSSTGDGFVVSDVDSLSTDADCPKATENPCEMHFDRMAMK